MVTRRQALMGAALTTAALLVPEETNAGAPLKLRKALVNVNPRPLRFDPEKLQGLSPKLLRSHYDNNYSGAVRKLNHVRKILAATPKGTPAFQIGALKMKELAFSNSVVLHEYYFGNLGPLGEPRKKTREALATAFGGLAKFEEEFRTLGSSLGGGSGWVILSMDTRSHALGLSISNNHTQSRVSSTPLLVLDMYEHSYHMDYGTKVGPYVDAFWANINWAEVDKRLARATVFSKTRVGR